MSAPSYHFNSKYVSSYQPEPHHKYDSKNPPPLPPLPPKPFHNAHAHISPSPKPNIHQSPTLKSFVNPDQHPHPVHTHDNRNIKPPRYRSHQDIVNLFTNIHAVEKPTHPDMIQAARDGSWLSNHPDPISEYLQDKVLNLDPRGKHR